MSAEAEMRAILQELHDKFNTRVYGTSSYIKRDMRDRIAKVLASMQAEAPQATKDAEDVVTAEMMRAALNQYNEGGNEGGLTPKVIAAALAARKSQGEAP